MVLLEAYSILDSNSISVKASAAVTAAIVPPEFRVKEHGGPKS